MKGEAGRGGVSGHSREALADDRDGVKRLRA
jgi:hypothetical protein